MMRRSYAKVARNSILCITVLQRSVSRSYVIHLIVLFINIYLQSTLSLMFLLEKNT